MRTSLQVLAVAAMAALLIQGCGEQSSSSPATAPAAAEAEAVSSAKGAVNDVRPDGLVTDWNVMVFTVTTVSDRNKSDEYYKETFDKDYLASMGGEAKAVLVPGAKAAYKDGSGAAMTAEAEAMEANSLGWVASEWGDDLLGRKVAYGSCVLKSDADQAVTCYFGSDDECKVYVNGELAHESYDSRACESRQDEFTVNLKKGLNPVMVKTSQRSQSWVFVLEVFPEE